MKMRSCGWALIQYDWCLYKEEEIRTQTHTEGSPCEDTGRWLLPTSQGGRPPTKPPLPAPWTSSFQNSEKINSCCLSCPACGILLQQPEQTKTSPIQIALHCLTLYVCHHYYLYDTIFWFISCSCLPCQNLTLIRWLYLTHLHFPSMRNRWLDKMSVGLHCTEELAECLSIAPAASRALRPHGFPFRAFALLPAQTLTRTLRSEELALP